MPLQIIHRDITTVSCDVIVNPTDEIFSGSGGTDYSVHCAAGPELRIECDRQEKLSVGKVCATRAYNLPCKYIIHTQGPVWAGGFYDEEVLLRSCYLNALIQARKLKAETIAFPLISAGTFGFPKDRVLRVALTAMADFLSFMDGEINILLCVFDRQSYELSEKIELDAFLKSCSAASETEVPEGDLADWIHKQDDTFAVTLLKLIDSRGMTEAECYKKANVSKQTFWKICNDKKYRPGKTTALAFAVALQLSYKETEQLLKTVGFTFSHSNKADMIVEFFIRKGNYDIYEINAALYQFDQPLLGM